MARDEAVRDGYPPVTSEGETAGDSTSSSDRRPGIHRRSILKAAGTAVASAGALSATSAAASISGDFQTIDHGEYTEYVVAPGGQFRVRLGNGDSFENALIDITATGADAMISNENGWSGTPPARYEIRNVAVVGGKPRSGAGRLFITGCTDHCLVENVWAGDGCTGYPVSGNYHDWPGAWGVPPTNSGTVEIRNVYLAEWIDNAFYMSPPGHPGPGHGRVEIYDSYVRDSQISCYRFGTNDRLVNCYGEINPHDHRVVWAYYNTDVDLDVQNCSLNDTGNGSRAIVFGRDSGTVRLSNTEYTGISGRSRGTVIDNGGNTLTSSPRHFVPEGCPTNPMEAVTGGGSGGGGSGGDDEESSDEPVGREHLLYIEGHTDEETPYAFGVTGGPIETSSYDQATYDDRHEIDDDGTRASAVIQGWYDAWEFDGDLHWLEIEDDGAATFTLDGEVIDPADYPDEDEAGDGEEDEDESDDEAEDDGPEELAIVTPDGADLIGYEFVVDGDADFADLGESPSGDPIVGGGNDHITDGDDGTALVEGYTGNGHGDGFLIDGPVLAFDAWNAVDDDAEPDFWLELNGEVISVAELLGEDEGPAYENVLVIDGDGADETSRYAFAVDGAVHRVTRDGEAIEDGDGIDDDEILGRVLDWENSYGFDGGLETLTVDGPATAILNGEVIDPDDYGPSHPHSLAIVGQGETASYEVSVDGAIVPLPTVDASATSENVVEGTVKASVHAFEFSGEITDVSFVDGSAPVYVDGQRVNPDDYGDQGLLPHAFVVDGTGTDEPTTYSFSVSGDVVPSEYADATVDDEQSVSGRTVTGEIGDWVDAYWFGGDLLDFTVDGGATFRVEYNARSR